MVWTCILQIKKENTRCPLKLLFIITKKSGKRGSNSRPPAWEASALPTELLPHSTIIIQELYFNFTKMEPIPGLEPGTYALRMRCSTNWAISAKHSSKFSYPKKAMQRYIFFLYNQNLFALFHSSSISTPPISTNSVRRLRG